MLVFVLSSHQHAVLCCAMSCHAVLCCMQLLKLMDQFPDVVFLKVDFDSNKAMCKTLGVKVRGVSYTQAESVLLGHCSCTAVFIPSQSSCVVLLLHNLSALEHPFCSSCLMRSMLMMYMLCCAAFVGD